MSEPNGAPTAEETMTIAAAREVKDGQVLLVGVGPPNAAANLARRLHAPGAVLVYESGAIEAKPVRLPLSIGDDDLAETAAELVSVPEMFNYWVGAGRIDVGFLGAAQIDRRGHLNSTVIGDYERPSVRLPGGGGAPEIAALAKEIIVIIRQSQKSFVERLDFRSSVGRPPVVITDLGVLRPDPKGGELRLAQIHPGVSVEQAREATGWDLRVAEDLEETAAPSAEELGVLRELRATLGAAA
jgi:glutaconate CoA-transferase subunit B